MVVSQILIYKPRGGAGGVHKPGIPVTGVVRYAIDKPTEYKEVTLSFLGKGVCRWSEDSGGTSSFYHGLEDYVTYQINLKNKRPQDIVTLNGVYEYPFEFYLPEDIPNSYKDNIGNITYLIQLKFVKSNLLSFKKVFTAAVPVSSPVSALAVAGATTPHEGPVIFGLEKTLFALYAIKNPVIKLKAEIAKTHVAPGESVHLYYEVTNHTNVTILSINTELYCLTTYTANCGHIKKVEVKVKGCEVTTPEVYQVEVRHFTCVLPTLPELFSIQRSKVISREYKVRVTVRLPIPHANAKVDMTIVIGERKSSTAKVDMGVDVMDDSAVPPSYWEAMSEEEVTEKEMVLFTKRK